MHGDIRREDDLLACFSNVPTNGSPRAAGPRTVTLALGNLELNNLELGITQETFDQIKAELWRTEAASKPAMKQEQRKVMSLAEAEEVKTALLESTLTRERTSTARGIWCKGTFRGHSSWKQSNN